MIELIFLHPGALKLIVLSEEVGLARQTVSRLAKAGDESVVELLFDAVIHTAVEYVVVEAVGEDKNDVTLPHIFMQELFGLFRVVLISAALEGEIMGLLLRGRSEVHFERVILLYMEKSIARVAQIRRLKLKAFYQPDNYCGGAALVMGLRVVARLEHQFVRRALRVQLRQPNSRRRQLHGEEARINALGGPTSDTICQGDYKVIDISAVLATPVHLIVMRNDHCFALEEGARVVLWY